MEDIEEYFRDAVNVAAISTQVWRYNMRDMFDEFMAADYECGTPQAMDEKWNKYRAIYIRAGYKVRDRKPSSYRKINSKTGLPYTEVSKTFFVDDVPLKCLNGRKARTLVVNLWMNV